MMHKNKDNEVYLLKIIFVCVNIVEVMQVKYIGLWIDHSQLWTCHTLYEELSLKQNQ